MYYVTITQTRTTTIPIEDATSANQAISLVAQEMLDNEEALADASWYEETKLKAIYAASTNYTCQES